jgi:hypothetical protein
MGASLAAPHPLNQRARALFIFTLYAMEKIKFSPVPRLFLAC